MFKPVLLPQANGSMTWASGLVGYDIALTRRRPPVRIRPGPLTFFSITLNATPTFMNSLTLTKVIFPIHRYFFFNHLNRLAY
jgi:hypothetical protein